MLLRAIVLIAIVAVLGETIITGATALGRAALHAHQMMLVRNGLATAIESAQSSARGNAVPQPTATCARGDANGCAVTMQTTITVATQPQQTGPCAGDCT